MSMRSAGNSACDLITWRPLSNPLAIKRLSFQVACLMGLPELWLAGKWGWKVQLRVGSQQCLHFCRYGPCWPFLLWQWFIALLSLFMNCVLAEMLPKHAIGWEKISSCGSKSWGESRAMCWDLQTKFANRTKLLQSMLGELVGGKVAAKVTNHSQEIPQLT